jgi:hypothetical protein
MNEFQPEDYIRYRIERAYKTLLEVESHLRTDFGIRQSIVCIMPAFMR